MASKTNYHSLSPEDRLKYLQEHIKPLSIVWQLSAWSHVFPQGWIRERFSDSAEADKRYLEIASHVLENPGDRVVLYRIKEEGFSKYRDAYKSDTLGRDGKLIHVRNMVPSSVEIAEMYREQATERRRRYYLQLQERKRQA